MEEVPIQMEMDLEMNTDIGVKIALQEGGKAALS